MTSLLLALPTACFICISILMYQMSIHALFDSIAPFLERRGIKEILGGNINLLILLGPVIAFLLTLFHVLKIDWQFTKEQFLFHFTIREKWFPMLIAGSSVSLLSVVSIYLIGENLVIR